MGRITKILGPLLLGGTLVGTSSFAEESPTQSSVYIDDLRSQTTNTLIAIMINGKQDEGVRDHARSIVTERINAATQKELVDFLSADAFMVRDQAYRLLRAHGTRAIATTRAPIDKTPFFPDEKIHSSEQRARLQSILMDLTYAELQLKWLGSIYQPTVEELAKVHSIGDLFHSLATTTGNCIHTQYFDPALADVAIAHPEQFSGKTFWDVIAMIRGPKGECVRVNTCHSGTMYIGEHAGKPLSTSTGAIYARMEHYREYGQILFFIQPNLCQVEMSVTSVQGTMQDGSVIDIAYWANGGNPSSIPLFSLSFPAATIPGETVDIDVECEVWALPMEAFIVDDVDKPASFTTKMLSIESSVLQQSPLAGCFALPLSVQRTKYLPMIDDPRQPKQFGELIGLMMRDEEGRNIGPVSSQTVHGNPLKKVWLVSQRPAHATFYIPQPILLHTRKSLHFADIPLPEKVHKPPEPIPDIDDED